MYDCRYVDAVLPPIQCCTCCYASQTVQVNGLGDLRVRVCCKHRRNLLNQQDLRATLKAVLAAKTEACEAAMRGLEPHR